jgi:hypothetical protein
MKKCCEQQHMFNFKMLNRSLAFNDVLRTQVVGWIRLEMMYLFNYDQRCCDYFFLQRLKRRMRRCGPIEDLTDPLHEDRVS